MLILRTHFEQVSLVIVRKMIEEQFRREAAIEQDQEAKKKSLEEDLRARQHAVSLEGVMTTAMKPNKKNAKSLPKKNIAFDAQTFLDTAGVARVVKEVKKGEVVYSQGDPAESVIYLQEGGVKLTVISESGKEAVVAMLGKGDFFGEGCLAAQPVRMGTATSVMSSTMLVIEKREMFKVLHEQHGLSDIFINFMLARNIRIEEDLIDQLFNSSEKRLARTLLLLARYGKEDAPHGVHLKISQETLAEIIGTTRSRVNFFMNKFRKLGFIKYNGSLQVNTSLLNVVLHE